MNAYYDSENRRLIYYGHSPTSSWWDSYWSSKEAKGAIDARKNDRFVLKTLGKYIADKKGRILEGGCGSGQVLYCMCYHGYEATGVDFAAKTVERIKEEHPEIDIRMGDIRNLEFPDGYFAVYWSGGVIEHFQEGYQDTMDEMYRVLRDGGYLVLSFPYMSPLRKLKARLGLYKEFDGEQEDSFYQFALDMKNVINDAQMRGFIVLERKARDGLLGITFEVGILKPLFQNLVGYEGKSSAVRAFRWFLDSVVSIFSGHVILLVFRKTDANPLTSAFKKRQIDIRSAE